jgi:hypothetical protein
MGGSCRFSGRGPQLDLQAFLETRLRPELQRCGGKLGEAHVEIETTREEIVTVALSGNTDPLDPAVATCFTESAWALLLPAAFDQDFASFRVDL